MKKILIQRSQRCIRLVLTVALAIFFVGSLADGADAESTYIYLKEGDGSKIDLPSETATVYIADPMIADARAISPTAIYLTGYAPGRTTVVVTAENGQVSAEYDVHIVPASGGAEAVLPAETSLRREKDIAIISGRVSDINSARGVVTSERVLGKQDVISKDETTYGKGNQISLRVRFVEASRSELRRLGVNLSALGTSSAGLLQVVTGASDPSGLLSGKAITEPSLGGRVTSGNFNVDTLINALEDRGAVQILSEPTLTTVSGRKASFRAGGEIGYPINQGNGVISAEFKQYGVSIDFLPTLLPNDRIAIEVQPEVSFLDQENRSDINGSVIPGLSIRRAETTVEVGSGQTFAIAGLYEQYSQNNRRGPLGMSAVFGRSNSVRQERELIIFITPYIVEANNVVTPLASQQPAMRNMVGFITR